ncbi:tetratricopeptide repeat protein [Anaeromyxobacter dehalogenans]|nr:tetratricopeptide repeat protein [Anaeromyxobacter dehalogenans]
MRTLPPLAVLAAVAVAGCTPRAHTFSRPPTAAAPKAQPAPAAAVTPAAAPAASPAQPTPPGAATPPAPAAEPGGRRPRTEVLVARAEALRGDGDLEGAREILEAAFALAPGSGEARLALADLLVADGRELDRAATLIAGAPEAAAVPRRRVLAGRLAELRGDDAAAVAEYAAALDLGADAEVRVRRALALERLGRGDEALLELHRASRERPGDALVRARLAERYEAAGLLPAAEAELVAAAEATPDRAAGWDRLARFYARTHREDKARAAEAKARAAAGTPRERVLRPLLPSSR